MSISNHYETLNVSNDASAEEIKASYQKLYKIFHPDLNPEMIDGQQMIAELNKAYIVLRDPQAKAEYDMLFMTELSNRKMARAVPVQAQVQAQAPVALPALPKEIIPELPRIDSPDQYRQLQHRQPAPPSPVNNTLRIAAVSAIVMLGALLLNMNSTESSSKIKMMDLSEIISSSKYVRPVTAPNGSAFPETTAYISGYELANNSGNSSLSVDNLRGENDVYLKLISLQDKKAVRHVFIKAKSEFKIENLTTGKYEVQYLDLVAGLVGKSEVFTVEETTSAMGVKASSKSITLQTAVNGVLRVETISIDEFNSLASL